MAGGWQGIWGNGKSGGQQLRDISSVYQKYRGRSGQCHDGDQKSKTENAVARKDGEEGGADSSDKTGQLRETPALQQEFERFPDRGRDQEVSESRQQQFGDVGKHIAVVELDGGQRAEGYEGVGHRFFLQACLDRAEFGEESST